MKVKTKTNSTCNHLQKVTTAIQMGKQNKLIFYKKYRKNITIQYGKHTLTGIYSQKIINGAKEIYLITGKSISEIEAKISHKKEEITKRIDEALYDFAKEFSILLPFKTPAWSRYEDFVKGEDYIDRIPSEAIIHDTYFKKVYGEGIEFIKAGKEEPTAHLKHYIKNRAIEDIAPTIASSINNLAHRFDVIGNRVMDMMEVRMKVDKELAINIKTHNKVFKKLDRLLSQKKLKEWI